MTRRDFTKLGMASVAMPWLKTFAAKEGPCRLKIGVLSDIHVPSADVTEHFRKALKWFDAKKAEGVIIAGDLGYNGLIREMKVVADVWDEIFPGDKRSDGGHIEKLFVTGNHDVDGYFYHQPEFPKVKFPADPEKMKDSFVFNRERVWKELFHEDYAPIQVKEINGYKFVLRQWYAHLASDVCSDRWLTTPPDEPLYNSIRYEHAELAKFFAAHGAELKAEKKPWFFIQHHHPGNALYSPWNYGSRQGWGEHDAGETTEYLKNYPNCVTFSGHAHISPVFEQSIWQGDFTSIETSACPGWAMAGAAGGGRANCRRGDENARGTQFDNKTPKVGQFMYVYDDRIVLESMEFSTGEALTGPREFPWPISRGKPYAYDTRRERDVAPEFPPDAQITCKESEDEIEISFPTVRNENAGHRAIDYEVTFTARTGMFRRVIDQRRVYSEGMALPEKHDRKPVTVVYSKKDYPYPVYQDYRFEVRPCDSWDKKGKPLYTPFVGIVG